MAKKGAPPEQVPGALVTVEGERERTIALLTEHFSQDNLSMDDFEKRVEQAYRASTVPALRELTRDLVPAASAAVAPAAAKGGVASAEFEQEHERITAIMSSTKRKGVWRPARRVHVLGLMSEAKLDLTQAVLQPGVTEIRVHALMSTMKIIVPPGVRVVLQAGSIMSSVSDETLDPPPVGSGAPVVRITGTIMMSELKAVVRKRELAAADDEDEK